MLSRAIRQQGLTSARAFGTWANCTAAPPDLILGLNEAFKKETNPKKQLLGMGVYRCNESKPYILECVRRAEKKILADNMDHEYSPIEGIASYTKKALTLAFGADCKQLKENRIAAAQGISGTGSLRLGL